MGQFLFSGVLLQGAWVTLELAVLAQFTGIILGVIAALARQSHIALLRWPAHFYVWFFRGTPVLVQIYFWFAGLPQLSPNVHPDFFQQALLALGINEGAYMAEIVRAGLAAVDPGQEEAARSLGMRYGLMMRRIILPQAARVIIPPTGNEFISMLKTTSLAGIISVEELLHNTQALYNQNLKVLELLTVASLYYLAMTSVFSILQAQLESRLGERKADRGISLMTRLTGLGRAGAR
ncbi:MAG: amino acid ABC transporter permease [Chloroflexota bacterium]